MMVRTVAVLAAFVTVLGARTAEAALYTFTRIEVPGATQTVALGINNYGDITGYAVGETGLHGFVYEAGRYRTLDFPGAWETVPAGINDSGQVAGGVTREPFGEEHGFVYDGATFRVLAVPGAGSGVAVGINNYGDIVGTYGDNMGQHGFLFLDDEFIPLDVPMRRTLYTRAMSAILRRLAGTGLPLTYSDPLGGRYVLLGMAARDRDESAPDVFEEKGLPQGQRRVLDLPEAQTQTNR